MAVIWKCPGIPGTTYGHGLTEKSVHTDGPDGCCARFARLHPKEQKATGCAYPAPDLPAELLDVTEEIALLLADVDYRDVHWVEQRSSTYGMNFRTLRRCTRQLRPLIEVGAVAKGWDKGVRCQLTDLGRAALTHWRTENGVYA